MLRCASCCFVVASLLVLAADAHADEELPAANDPPRLLPTAAADVYWAYHDTEPVGRVATLATTGGRQNEFAINLVAVGVRLEHAKITGAAIVHAGTSVDALYAWAGNNAWKYIQEAHTGYRLGDWHFQAGLMPSGIGYEDFVSSRNSTYARAMIADLTPYYVLGLRATWRISEFFSLGATVFNGWQTFQSIGGEKSGMITAVFRPNERFSLQNVLIGGTVATDNPIGATYFSNGTVWRFFDDLVLTYRPIDRLQFALEAWVGREQGATFMDSSVPTAPVLTESPMYFGGALQGRVSITDSMFIAARVEALSDRSGVLTGHGLRSQPRATPLGQDLFGATLTLGYRPHPRVVAKIEGMHREASQPYFAGSGSNLLSPSGVVESEARVRTTSLLLSVASDF